VWQYITYHTRVIFHWAAAGRPASIPEQQRYQNIDFQRCTGSGTEPCHRAIAAAVNENETQQSGNVTLKVPTGMTP